MLAMLLNCPVTATRSAPKLQIRLTVWLRPVTGAVNALLPNRRAKLRSAVTSRPCPSITMSYTSDGAEPKANHAVPSQRARPAAGTPFHALKYPTAHT